ncbi:hypothetical protein EDB80DRAFT_739890 [Ilyonectria destructans]|nr:hypothetical protein EDB80DRAFT_739890 [Ilyonectria destructans]
MARIGQSKWDNMDTDSEPEMLSQQAPVPKATLPPTLASVHSTLTAAHRPSGPIQAVIAWCDAEKIEFPP